MGGYALSEVEEAPSYSADEVEEAPTAQQSSATIDQVTRPQSRAPVAPASTPSLSLGPAPPKPRPVAEGLVTEQQERRGGMPLSIQPASGSLFVRRPDSGTKPPPNLSKADLEAWNQQQNQVAAGYSGPPHPEQVVATPRPNATLAQPAKPNVTPQPFQEPGAAVGLGAAPGTPPAKDLPDVLDALRRGGASVGREMGEDVMGAYERMRHPGISVMNSPGGPYLAPTRPLVGPESDVALAEKEHPLLTGAARAVGSAAGSMATDPATYAFAALPLAEAGPILSRIVSGAFGAQATVGAIRGAKQLKDHWKELTPAQRSEIATQTGLDSVFGLLGTAGAVHGIRGNTLGKPYAQPDLTTLDGKAEVFKNLLYKYGANVPDNPTEAQVHQEFRKAVFNATTDPGSRGNVSARGTDWHNITTLYNDLKQSGYFKGKPIPAPGEPTRAQLAEYLDASDHDPNIARVSHMVDESAKIAPEAASPAPAAPAENSQPAQPAPTPAEPPAAGVSPSPIQEFRADEVEEAKPAIESTNGNARPNVLHRPTGSVGSAAKPAPAPNQPVVAAPAIGTPSPQPVAPATTPASAKESPFQKDDAVTLPDGRSGQIKYVAPEGKSPVVTVTVDGKTERFVGDKAVQGLTRPAPDTYKYGSTQANIPDESPAAKALETARSRISKEDLAGDGIDVGGNHVTVRYGIKGEDVEGVKKYLASLPPFEASLGSTEIFPPSEHSDGAAVIHAPIESPELHQINAELEKHGDFIEPSFDEYKPHATVAYVKPEKASRYVGMNLPRGRSFPSQKLRLPIGKATSIRNSLPRKRWRRRCLRSRRS